MPLKAIFTKEEYEPLGATRKELYVEKDGKYVLDAEGVEDVTGLQNEAPHLSEPSNGGGAQNTPGGNSRAIRLTREEPRNPQAYRAAKAQAENWALRWRSCSRELVFNVM